jgi:hypothetical protein
MAASLGSAQEGLNLKALQTGQTAAEQRDTTLHKQCNYMISHAM